MISNLRLSKVIAYLTGLTIILNLSGCMDLKGTTPPNVEDSDAFANLSFTTAVAYVKLKDTLPLRLIALAADGSNIPVNKDQVHWISSDESVVYVDTVGRIVGRDITEGPVDVMAIYRHAYTTRVDTIQVYVTQTASKISAGRITALDSTRVGYTGTTTGGLLVPRVRVDFIDEAGEVSNPNNIPIQKPESITLTYMQKGGPANEPVYLVASRGTFFGSFWIKVSINFYGIEVRDSVEFTALHRYGLPSYAISEIDGKLSLTGPDPDGKVIIQPCGIVTFASEAIREFDIVFSDSLASSDGCEPLSTAAVGLAAYLGEIYKGDFVGGNLLSVLSGTNYYYRRSNSRGEVRWHLRDAVTKESLPIRGKFQIIDVE